MKYSFLSALLALGVSVFSSDLSAQNRDFAAERLILDDNIGGRLTVEYAGPGNATFTFPAGGGTLVPYGMASDQTLRWDGSAWQATSALLNDGTDLTASGNVAANAFAGNGTLLTDLDASEITTGTLALPRISTAGALGDQALTYSGGNLVYGNPQAGSIVVPLTQFASSNSWMLNLTNTGTAGAAQFFIFNAANNQPAVNIATNGTGASLQITSQGGGTALTSQAINASTGRAGLFENLNAANTNDVLYVRNIGNGNASQFLSTSGSATGDAIFASQAGSGEAIHATMSGTGITTRIVNTNNANTSSTLHVTNAGTSSAAFISNTNAAATGAAASVLQAGIASGIFVNISNNASNGASILVNNAGNGPGYAASTTGDAISAVSSNGRAGRFRITDVSNASDGIGIEHAGLGRGLDINLSNATNASDALYIDNDGAGGGIEVQMDLGTNNQAGVLISHDGSGYGVQSFSNTGIGVYGLSNTVHGGWFQSVSGTALRALTAGANQYAIAAQNTDANGDGLLLNAPRQAIIVGAGGLRGSVADITAGDPISTTAMISNILDNGNNLTATTATLPVGTHGQIVYVTTNDAQGFSVGGFTGTWGEVKVFVNVNGAWKGQP
jgi:hypothetical protein